MSMANTRFNRCAQFMGARGLSASTLLFERRGTILSRYLALGAKTRERRNTFEALVEAAKVCSLGSMSHALYDVGGEYRRNM